MIRGTLGFGVCDATGASLTFDLPANTGNQGYDAFFNYITAGPGGPGAGNAAAKWENLGFLMATRIFDVQPAWTIGFNIKPFNQYNNMSMAFAQDKFLQLANAIGENILALEIETDGTLAVVSGGDGTSGTGTIEKKSTGVLTNEAWSGYFELQATGFGGSTTVQVWLDDVLFISVVFATAAGPDRLLLGSQNGTTGGGNYVVGFGLAFANVYIADGQGPLPWNARLGPVRITSMSPNADAGGNWNIAPNTLTDRYQAVDDLYPSNPAGSPDDDSSYISPLSLTNNNQWFTFPKAPCYGLVLGVMVNLVFRGASGSTTCNALLLQITDQATIGTATVTGLYQCRQLFQGLSLQTGQYFNDAEIAGALWGVSTSSPGLMLTQMFLEKIVSLRSVAYSCGQSSYSF